MTRSRSLRRALPAVLLMVLAAACASPEAPTPDGEMVPNHDPATAAIVGLDRMSDGELVAGEVTSFQARLANTEPRPRTLSWRASGGDLEPDGEAVRWRLPAAAEAWLEVTLHADGADDVSARFSFQVQASPEVASNEPRGEIDPDREETTGARCAVVMDHNDRAQVVYFNSTHPSIWYAAWNGAAWQIEMIDGLGFEVGGEVRGPLSLAVDASNRPHVAYSIGDRISYATRSTAGTWTIERVDTSIQSHGQAFQVAIALDPSSGNRPTVAYTSSAGVHTVVAYRTVIGTWVAAESTGSAQYHGFAGGLVFNGATAYLTTGYSYSSGSGSELITWSAAGGFTAPQSFSGSSGTARIVLDDTNRPVIFNGAGVYHRGAGGVWSHSDVEASWLPSVAIAWGGGKPQLALAHSGWLELITTDARGYWHYSHATPVSYSYESDIGIALDAAGAPHLCYQHDGRVRFW